MDILGIRTIKYLKKIQKKYCSHPDSTRVLFLLENIYTAICSHKFFKPNTSVE